MLFRAFYALPRLDRRPDGNPVNALLGAADLILREMELHARARWCSAWPRRRSFRTELYPAYDAERRRQMPDQLFPQWAACRAFFEAFGWTVARATISRPTTCWHLRRA